MADIDMAGNITNTATGAAAGTAVAPGIGTAIGAGVGLLGGLFGGGGGQTERSGLELPREFELDLIDTLGENLNQINESYARVTAAADVFDKRIRLLESAAQRQIPSQEVIAQLRDNSMQLATTLGASSQELAENGFLTAQEAQDFEMARQLTFGRGELQGQAAQAFEEQKGALIQDLRRSGASPAVIEQSLRQLENSFKQGAASGILDISARQSAQRQAGFAQSLQGLSALEQQRAGVRQDLQVSAGLAQGRAQGTSMFEQLQERLRDQRLGQFERLGEFDISKKTNREIARGNIGPLGEGSPLTATVREAGVQPTNKFEEIILRAKDKR